MNTYYKNKWILYVKKGNSWWLENQNGLPSTHYLNVSQLKKFATQDASKYLKEFVVPRKDIIFRKWKDTTPTDSTMTRSFWKISSCENYKIFLEIYE